MLLTWIMKPQNSGEGFIPVKQTGAYPGLLVRLAAPAVRYRKSS
jgi:hypothetical protein